MNKSGSRIATNTLLYPNTSYREFILFLWLLVGLGFRKTVNFEPPQTFKKNSANFHSYWAADFRPPHLSHQSWQYLVTMIMVGGSGIFWPQWFLMQLLWSYRGWNLESLKVHICISFFVKKCVLKILIDSLVSWKWLQRLKSHTF